MTDIICPSYKAGFASPQRGLMKYPQLWKDCVGAWAPLLGPTGSTLRDQSPYGNHGTLITMDTATDWTVNNGKHALYFDGTNNATSATITQLVFPFTMSCWVKFNVIGANLTGMSINEPTSSARQFCLGVGADGVNWAFYARNGTFSNAYGSAATTEWTHLCGVALSATSRTIYVDGIQGLTATSSVQNSILTTCDLGRLGDSSPSSWLTGYADDAMIYSRELSGSEIALLATRRGIAYETVQRRSYKSPAGPHIYGLFKPVVLRASR